MHKYKRIWERGGGGKALVAGQLKKKFGFLYDEYLRHIESAPNNKTLVLEAQIFHKGPDIEGTSSAELDPDPLAVHRGNG